ncbi:MAG: FAD-binding oxidoreductase [Candidatus Dormibacteraeota bacterium]|uniref:FAD-binding oxidoreductase n=1 Tax=Candidatus Amunia macphersoniae TaxID=3127014 RepID=A0A934NH97_9BACT|nr:FAD-binding oxidoreductase [Candidatus Dormibacteraeota bacterium]
MGIPLGVHVAPAAREAVTLPPSRLADDALIAQLSAICGAEAVGLDGQSRLVHAAGRSYLDLLRLRSGDIGVAPDGVIWPSSEQQIAAVLRACAAADCAVVPFGGGTSVVGGVTPSRGSHRAVISLDLRRLDRWLAVHPVSRVAVLQAGMTGTQAEAALTHHGLTLGHFPQSCEYATIGGFAATRSAGQASSGYGRFDDLVLGLRMVSPAGEIVVAAHPASAAGPSIRELVLGSEGRLGVITEVTVKVRPWPQQESYEAWSFAHFTEGIHALRAMTQGGVAPDVARLSDHQETRVGMAMASRGGAAETLGRRYLRARGHQEGCLLIAGWDSDALLGGARQAEARAIIRRHRGIALGASPGQSWLRQRFHGPYLRDALLDAGVLVETVETATSWANLARLHDAVASALDEALRDGHTPLVGCHVSHVYPSGASLYFTVLARSGNDPRARWLRAKEAACNAILDNDGTITHHHAVGTDHLPYLEREIGIGGVAALRAVAAQLDPTGIMNPGKLIPDAPAAVASGRRPSRPRAQPGLPGASAARGRPRR